jgi:hypothetical protein
MLGMFCPQESFQNGVLICSYAATRIFVSAKPLVVQRFVEMVILDRVREDIHENKKLNVHLFSCLKKSLYKPAGFFKGISLAIHLSD